MRRLGVGMALLKLLEFLSLQNPTSSNQHENGDSQHALQTAFFAHEDQQVYRTDAHQTPCWMMRSISIQAIDFTCIKETSCRAGWQADAEQAGTSQKTMGCREWWHSRHHLRTLPSCTSTGRPQDSGSACRPRKPSLWSPEQPLQLHSAFRNMDGRPWQSRPLRCMSLVLLSACASWNMLIRATDGPNISEIKSDMCHANIHFYRDSL